MKRMEGMKGIGQDDATRQTAAGSAAGAAAVVADNPRFALYKSSYTCFAANRMDEEPDMEASLVGRCCESGDIIQEHVPFPPSVGRGDLVAVCTTGAYNYAMASNYNRLCRPATVMLSETGNYVAVRRETFEDLTALDE